MDCETTPGDGKCVVFLGCEDFKGKFYLCSGCWMARNKENEPLPVPEPSKKKKRRKKR
jgi:hypothetical protein